MRKTAVSIIIIILATVLVGGCAPMRLKIQHEPLAGIENKKQGTILVRQFSDTRRESLFIGDIRNRFGLEIGRILTESDVKLSALLTNYFAEALRAAGYTTVIQNPLPSKPPSQPAFDAIIEGEITIFWLDLYDKINQSVEVRMRALNSAGKNVVWEKTIKADRSDGIWWGTTEEYERVICLTLTQALNEAAKEYASEEFFNAVRHRRP